MPLPVLPWSHDHGHRTPARPTVDLRVHCVGRLRQAARCLLQIGAECWKPHLLSQLAGFQETAGPASRFPSLGNCQNFFFAACGGDRRESSAANYALRARRVVGAARPGRGRHGLVICCAWTYECMCIRCFVVRGASGTRRAGRASHAQERGAERSAAREDVSDSYCTCASENFLRLRRAVLETEALGASQPVSMKLG